MFYYLVQDLKALMFSLISLHFKVCYPVAVSLFSNITNSDKTNLISDMSYSDNK